MVKSKRFYFFSFVISVLLIAFDQFTKYLALTLLKPISTVTIVEGFFDLSFVENRGAAFGIMQGARWFFVVVTPIVLICIIIYFVRLPKAKPYNYIQFALIAIVSGAFGNFLDRLRNGYVVDFFHVRFIDFPVFNMADIYVVLGTISMAIILLFFVKEEELEKTITKPVNQKINSETSNTEEIELDKEALPTPELNGERQKKLETE